MDTCDYVTCNMNGMAHGSMDDNVQFLGMHMKIKFRLKVKI